MRSRPDISLGKWDYYNPPQLVLTSSAGHQQNMYCWQSGCMHPTAMLSSYVGFILLSFQKNGQLNYILHAGTKLGKVWYQIWHLIYFALFCNDNKYTEIPVATIISWKELILMWAEEISPVVNASWRTLRPYFFRPCIWLPSHVSFCGILVEWQFIIRTRVTPNVTDKTYFSSRPFSNNGAGTLSEWKDSGPGSLCIDRQDQTVRKLFSPSFLVGRDYLLSRRLPC